MKDRVLLLLLAALVLGLSVPAAALAEAPAALEDVEDAASEEADAEDAPPRRPSSAPT